MKKDDLKQKKIEECINLVKYLINFLGISVNSDPNQHSVSVEYLLKKIDRYTHQEIKEAFSLFVSCKLNLDLKVLPVLNPRVIGSVLNAYDEYIIIEKNKKNKKEIKKTKTEKDIENKKNYNKMLEAVDRAKKNVEQHGTIELPFSHIYDFLYKEKLLPDHTKVFKKKYIELAKPKAKRQIDNQKLQNWEFGANVKAKENIKEIENGTSASIINICKELILIDYFKSKIENEKMIEI